MGMRGQTLGNERRGHAMAKRVHERAENAAQAKYRELSEQKSEHLTVWQMPHPLKPPSSSRA